jgi:DNA-binding NarL/FixJ family response regulator
MIRVAVVAPSPLVQAGLRRALVAPGHLETVVLAASMQALRAALVRLPGLQAEVAIIDCRGAEPDTSALAAALDAGIKVVVLSDADPQRLAPLIAAGAACLPAAARDEEIVAAVEAVAAGLIALRAEWFDDLLRGRGALRVRPPAERVEPLTPRELQVLRLLAGGLANKHIAHDLGISEHTAKFHVGRILDKLEATTRAQAVAIGLREGLIRDAQPAQATLGDTT